MKQFDINKLLSDIKAKSVVIRTETDHSQEVRIVDLDVVTDLIVRTQLDEAAENDE